jgi:hypothetical protein
VIDWSNAGGFVESSQESKARGAMTARVSVTAMSAPQANLEGKQQRGYH